MDGLFCRFVQFYAILCVLVSFHWLIFLVHVTLSGISDSALGHKIWTFNHAFYGSYLILLLGSISLNLRLRISYENGGTSGGGGSGGWHWEDKCWTLGNFLLSLLTFPTIWLLYKSNLGLIQLGHVAVLSAFASLLGMYWADFIVDDERKSNAAAVEQEQVVEENAPWWEKQQQKSVTIVDPYPNYLTNYFLNLKESCSKQDNSRRSNPKTCIV